MACNLSDEKYQKQAIKRCWSSLDTIEQELKFIRNKLASLQSVEVSEPKGGDDEY
jgi:hypothetical protein